MLFINKTWHQYQHIIKTSAEHTILVIFQMFSVYKKVIWDVIPNMFSIRLKPWQHWQLKHWQVDNWSWIKHNCLSVFHYLDLEQDFIKMAHLTQAERIKQYRERKKEDPQYKEKVNLRGQKKWRAVTESQRAKGQTRIRMQRYISNGKVGHGNLTPYTLKQVLGKAVKKVVLSLLRKS